MTLEQYIDNINQRYRLGNATEHTFRGDLTKKKETTPDGSTDQNVFDIMQGVSINIFVKKKK